MRRRNWGDWEAWAKARPFPPLCCTIATIGGPWSGPAADKWPRATDNRPLTTNMHYRWYPVVVVGLWLTTMGWLVVKKVVPAFRVGTPPSYDEIVKDQIKAAPVGWRMSGGTGGTASGWC